MKEIIFVKLGGSVITDKSKENKAKLAIIRQLVKEIGEAYKQTSTLFVIGHGAGSFGHPQAQKYRTVEGKVAKNSALGAAIVREAVTSLNTVMVKEFVAKKLPAVTLSPNSFLISNKTKLSAIFMDPFKSMMENGLLPVIHGDVVPDKSLGWTIFSGETTLNILAIKSRKAGYNPKLIIEVGATEGVLDERGETIPIMKLNHYGKLKKLLKGSEHADVTGGMLHKVREAIHMARTEPGIPTLLISAEPGNLRKALLGQKVKGTLIA